MNWGAEFILLIGVFLGLLFGGLWVPFAIGIAGLISLVLNDGLSSLRGLGLISWGSMNSFTLTAIPLFILMSDVLVRSGLSDGFYRGLSVLVQRLPGGLLQTNIAGCAFFAAISGSSVATAAAIGTVAVPQLRERGYSTSMSYGSLAAGGTLGILIPPSIAMIIYGAFTETSIAQLFMAGLIPGIALTLLFMIYIAVRAWMSPEIAPRNTEAVSFRQVVAALKAILPFVVLMLTVLGGIYLGVTTPTEAGAIGALRAIVISVVWGGRRIKSFMEALDNSVRISCMIMLIILCAHIFAYAVEFAGLGTNLANWLVSFNLGRLEYLSLLFVVFMILGCVVDSIGMILLTVPLIFPTLLALGIDPIWFGVALVLLIELGQITPPLGLNLFVLQGSAADRLGIVIRGTIPYYFIIVFFLILLTIYPQIAMWLPEQMHR